MERISNTRTTPRITARLLGSAAVAALGGFLFGFDTAVISGTTDALRLQFGLDSNQLGFTVASALIGTIVGSIGAGMPSERYGRRQRSIGPPKPRIPIVLGKRAAADVAQTYECHLLRHRRKVGFAGCESHPMRRREPA